MKFRAILGLLVAILATIAITVLAWPGSKLLTTLLRTAPATVAVQPTAEEIAGLPERGAVDLFNRLPLADRGPVLEAWFTGLAPGDLSAADEEKLKALLNAWAYTDIAAARSWAAGLKNPAFRQRAIVGLAAAIAVEDPQQAYKDLISNGLFVLPVSDIRIVLLMDKLSRDAIATGGAASLTELWQRLPAQAHRLNQYITVLPQVSPDVDFAALMDALDQLYRIHRPLRPGGIMAQWAAQNREAATSYLLRNTGHENIDDLWQDLREAVSRGSDQPELQRWTRDFFDRLFRLSPSIPADFFRRTHLFQSPEKVIASLPADAPASERQRLAVAMVEAANDVDETDGGRVLEPLPPAERLPALRELRGIRHPDAILQYAVKNGATPPEQEELKERITRPRE